MSYSRMKIVVTAALVFAAGSPANAQEAEFIDLMRQNGCVAAEPPVFDAMLVEAFGGQDNEKMYEFAHGLLDDGTVWRERGIGTVLHPRHCGSNTHLLGHQEDGQQILALIRENGCRMTETEAERILPGTGIDKRQVGRIVGSWIKEGIAVRDADGVVLQGDAC